MFLALILLVAVASPAAAEPILKVVVAPSDKDMEQVYYLRATVSRPVGPQDGATEPCNGGASSPSTLPSPPASGTPNSLAPYVPKCAHVDSWMTCGSPIGCATMLPHAAFSYNVTNGNFSVSAATPGESVLDRHGSTGLGLEADCETCPPPTCC
jgi:hypothetical protein